MATTANQRTPYCNLRLSLPRTARRAIHHQVFHRPTLWVIRSIVWLSRLSFLSQGSDVSMTPRLSTRVLTLMHCVVNISPRSTWVNFQIKYPDPYFVDEHMPPRIGSLHPMFVMFVRPHSGFSPTLRFYSLFPSLSLDKCRYRISAVAMNASRERSLEHVVSNQIPRSFSCIRTTFASTIQGLPSSICIVRDTQYSPSRRALFQVKCHRGWKFPLLGEHLGR